MEEQLKSIISQIKTHEELEIVSKLYKKRWYEIDKELVRRLKIGDIIKWYKGKKVHWGIVTKLPRSKQSRYLKVVSIQGREWNLGGSVITKVQDPKRIRKILSQLKEQGFKFDVITR